jgi:hypothetical protein
VYEIITGSAARYKFTARYNRAVSVVTGSQISSRICSYLPGFSGVNFSGKGM